ncbi:hypothetical protein SCL_0464 [Sulfuricaulis limicola]|uniref:Uncharacterized protein n=1 Tax=Sulfuricaulis limicola TaxID=1620215 RepID=A0A1B4XDB8_9GAMM|nr:hypothetical protein [Sulfuricaulis limicola]BAV32786.1 hypothetical protein SCL_0464 [Sulfuricaulis limicola]
MKTRTGKRSKVPRLRVLRGGKRAASTAESFFEKDSAIVCYYGVAVQVTLVDGLELVEFEFLPDAA